MRAPRGPGFFLSREEAEAEAGRIGGTVRDVSYTFQGLPDSFWETLRASPQPAMGLIRDHASRYYAGSLESAWNDACEGRVHGVRPDICSGIDQRMRASVRVEEWQVVPPPSPETGCRRGESGHYSAPSGDGLLDARKWAAEAYACGDSMTDE